MAARSFDDELEQLFDRSLDAVFVAGFDGYLRRVNRGFARLLGYSHEEVLARPFIDNVHPDDVDAVRGALGELAAGNDLVAFECRQMTADGWVRWMEWNVTPRLEEGVAVGIGLDVTDRHVAMEQVSALRRIAMLVAETTQPHDLFARVAAEVARVVDVPAVSIASYDTDDSAVYLAATMESDAFAVGTRQPLDGTSVVAEIRRTHEPVRIDDYSELEGTIAELMRRSGGGSTVGSPIVVAGRLWGAMVVSAPAPEPLPPDTEARLADFTELLGSAIANAESREALERMAEEQAALRRVATLAARGVLPAEIFSAVSREVAKLFGTDAAYVGRFDPDGLAIVAVGVANSDPETTVGMRWELDDSMSTAKVFRTGRSARVDGADQFNVASPIGALARRMGTSCAVSSPITVDGRLWGAMSVAARESLPPDTADRLEKFTALVATAIANAESREALERLAEEQAALRRVATLVAQGASSSTVFMAVSEEIGRLFGDNLAAVGRYDADGRAITLVGIPYNVEGVEVGMRVEVSDETPAGMVQATGRSARLDRADWSSPVGEQLGVISSVTSPIIVEGRLWGAMSALARTKPLPADTEQRLERFSDLVATAIANAEAREALERVAEEQAALRRAATMVVEGVPPEVIFSAISDEVGRLFAADTAAVVRFEHDPPSIVVVGVGAVMPGIPVGTRSELDDSLAVTQLYRTGHSARFDDRDLARVREPFREAARRLDLTSTVVSPISVEGRLWGAISISAKATFPMDTETRLERFSDLLATALANAESRQALEALAAEQSALQRIATLVAQGAAAATVFAAVSEEVAELYSDGLAAVGRYAADGSFLTVVGVASDGEWLAVGSRLELTGWPHTPAAMVYATGRAARVDWSAATAEAARVDAAGRAARVDWSASVSGHGRRADIVSSVACPITVEGRLWGAVGAMARTKPLPLDTEARLERFSDLLATAIANAEHKSELAASRRRIVAASDEARRRIERDLHDGTQQRLVTLALAVRTAEADVPPERDDLRSELSRIATGLTDAVTELQEMSRGIHPAILSKGGLAAALRALARRSAVPVRLNITTEARPPEPIEVAAYYVASEAIANATKHARASKIDLSLAARDGRLELSVRDDGVGGADPRRGSGLVGLGDRVEAAGGSIQVESPRGGGTHIIVELPLYVEASQTP